jgi:diphosphomevalonate decarboxylase
VSDLARRASASAARSLFGGFVTLAAGKPGDTFLPAAPLAGPEHWDLRIVVVVTTESAKEIGSTEGMRHTARTSPFYDAWVERAPSMFESVRDAVLRRDLPALVAATEQSAFAMHACAMSASPPLVYWSSVTMRVLERLHQLRESGLVAGATIDAGPHVKIVCSADDATSIERHMREVPGVMRTIVAEPGAGAETSGVEASS